MKYFGRQGAEWRRSKEAGHWRKSRRTGAGSMKAASTAMMAMAQVCYKAEDERVKIATRGRSAGSDIGSVGSNEGGGDNSGFVTIGHRFLRAPGVLPTKYKSIKVYR